MFLGKTEGRETSLRRKSKSLSPFLSSAFSPTSESYGQNEEEEEETLFSFYFSERKVGFLIRMAEVQVRVKHNIATYDLALSQEETLGMLAQKLMDLTGGYLKLVEVLVFMIFILLSP